MAESDGWTAALAECKLSVDSLSSSSNGKPCPVSVESLVSFWVVAAAEDCHLKTPVSEYACLLAAVDVSVEV